MIRAIIVPDDATLYEIALLARDANLRMAMDPSGVRHVLFREVPPGWIKGGAVLRDADPLEATPCP